MLILLSLFAAALSFTPLVTKERFEELFAQKDELTWTPRFYEEMADWSSSAFTNPASEIRRRYNLPTTHESKSRLSYAPEEELPPIADVEYKTYVNWGLDSPACLSALGPVRYGHSWDCFATWVYDTLDVLKFQRCLHHNDLRTYSPKHFFGCGIDSYMLGCTGDFAIIPFCYISSHDNGYFEHFGYADATCVSGDFDPANPICPTTCDDGREISYENGTELRIKTFNDYTIYTIEDVRRAITAYGPMMITMEVSDALFYYGGGIFIYHPDDMVRRHIITGVAMGFGCAPNNNWYFIVRVNLGPWFGESINHDGTSHGYLRLHELSPHLYGDFLLPLWEDSTILSHTDWWMDQLPPENI